MKDKYSQRIDNGPREIWYVANVWKHAEKLKSKRIKIENIKGFFEVTWFDEDKTATCAQVAIHAKRIYEANLAFPVILSKEGGVMDGMHRIAKAWLRGDKEIDVVQFEENPPPDEVR